MLNEQALKEIILDITEDCDLSAEDIKEDTRLAGEGGLLFDSIDVLELITEIEKRYNIKIQDNSLMREIFSTFGSFFAYLKEHEK